MASPKSLRFALLLFLFYQPLRAEVQIEQRTDRTSDWITRNRFRAVYRSNMPSGVPILFQGELSAEFDPVSLRVVDSVSGKTVSSKAEWTVPRARICWKSTGASMYHLYFDGNRKGEIESAPEPAWVGAGDRVTYGRPGVRARLSVGLWGFPTPIDLDEDGSTDLIVGCTDHPSNGIYLFRNIGSNTNPLFSRAEWLGPGKPDLVVADFNGDGKPDLVTRGGYYSDVRRNRLSVFVAVFLPREYHIGRDDCWYPVDWDNDGRMDVLVGTSDWREYGWDDAFDAEGHWTRGPVHGYVYFHRNIGSNEKPEYMPPVRVEAGGKSIDRRGSPSPNPVDWFGRGRLDLVCGEFVDAISLFENVGTRREPRFADGRPLETEGQPLHLNLCMIQPRVVYWHPDGRPSLVVAEEDGRVAFFENRSPARKPPVLATVRYFEQVDPYLKSGALSRPVAADWNGDGKLDLISGNSAGYIQWFENVATKTEPAFLDRGYLTAGGRTIRIMAGPNGSIQGPIEAKWGYTNPWVVDWDLDGRLDILVNSIWGKVIWYRNTGTPTQPVLSDAQPVEVEWNGPAPKPAWNWWNPKGKELVTQWRTTPCAVDWNRDGLPDLVMLDTEGHLAFYERFKTAGNLRLKPPVRIFRNPDGTSLRLNEGRAGKSGRRKIQTADWDEDGDMDLIVDSENNAAWFENTGTQDRPVFVLRSDLVDRRLAGHNPTPQAADWNGDGKIDLLIGAEDGFFYFFDRRYIETLVRN